MHIIVLQYCSIVFYLGKTSAQRMEFVTIGPDFLWEIICISGLKSLTLFLIIICIKTIVPVSYTNLN